MWNEPDESLFVVAEAVAQAASTVTPSSGPPSGPVDETLPRKHVALCESGSSTYWLPRCSASCCASTSNVVGA